MSSRTSSFIFYRDHNSTTNHNFIYDNDDQDRNHHTYPDHKHYDVCSDYNIAYDHYHIYNYIYHDIYVHCLSIAKPEYIKSNPLRNSLRWHTINTHVYRLRLFI